MVPRRFVLVMLFTGMILSLAGPLMAAKKEIKVTVKTILASQHGKSVDPELKGLIKELKTVFKYSSYRLISKEDMMLGLGKTAQAKLPGNRTLRITPGKIKGKRLTIQLVISKKGKQIFKTVIGLLNKGSITVGGPRYKNGYLLLNIFSSF